MSANTLATTLALLIVAISAGGVMLAELAVSRELLQYQREFEARGGYVVVAFSEDGLTVSSCERLASFEGIRTAGAVKVRGRISFDHAPGTIYQWVTITPGAIQVLGGGEMSSLSHGSGFMIGSTAAEELGRESGMHLTSPEVPGIRRVSDVTDFTLRNPASDRWVMAIQTPTGTASECWVEFSPSAYAHASDLIRTLFSGSHDVTDLSLSPLLRRNDLARNPAAEFASRPEAHYGLYVGIAAAAFFWAITWSRRAELALYRAVGSARIEVAAMLQIESVILVLIGVGIGSAWALAVFGMTGDASVTPSQLLIAVRSVLLYVLVISSIAPLAVMLVGRETVPQQLKGG